MLIVLECFWIELILPDRIQSKQGAPEMSKPKCICTAVPTSTISLQNGVVVHIRYVIELDVTRRMHVPSATTTSETRPDASARTAEDMPLSEKSRSGIIATQKKGSSPAQKSLAIWLRGPLQGRASRRACQP